MDVVRNNYALAGSRRNSLVGVYVQVHGRRKPRWQLLRYVTDFNSAKHLLRAFDPHVRQCKELRAHHATGSANWMLFFTSYRGEPQISGKELGNLFEVIHPQQMAEITKE